MSERLCDICKLPLSGEMYGHGDGTGQRFAHPDCYWREKAERAEAEVARLTAERDEWRARAQQRQDWDTLAVHFPRGAGVGQ